MKYTIEIIKHTSHTVLNSTRIKGADMKKVCEAFDIEPKEYMDYDGKEYVEIDVPCSESSQTTIYKQSFDEIDLARVIIMLNQPKAVDDLINAFENK